MRSFWLSVILLVAPLPAAAQIVLPGTQPGELVDGLLPDALCSICHGDFDPSRAYEPWETWSGSMMANSARDPLFWSAVDIANQDVPGVGEFCLRCHAPRGWLFGRSETANGSALLGSPGNPGGDFEGIDCHFCHRLNTGPTGTPFFQNGQYWVDPGVSGQQTPIRGPYTDSQPPHRFVYSAYHVSSDLCATCHDLENPLVHLKDENGQDTGLSFPEQSTYLEWAASSFPTQGTQCQTCHMPDAAGFVCTDLYPHRDDIAQHDFVGANAFMSTVLSGLYGTSLGRTAAYQRAANLALDNLQNRSANLGLSVPSRLAGSGNVTAKVRVTNLTGHKLPTGYPEGRRMWLSVLVQDGDGNTLFESGHYDADSAQLVVDPDLHVYESRHGVHGQGPSFHLVLNDRIFYDSRIPPAGFVPETRTQPVGYTFEALPGGTLANWDEPAYSFAIPDSTVGPVTVTASLWYQTASRPYVDFLRDANVSGPDPLDPDPQAPSRGEKIHTLWENNNRSAPVLMRSVTRRIYLDRPSPTTALAPEPPPVPQLQTPAPNPFRDATEVVFSLPRPSETHLAVFDVTGRRVRSLAAGSLALGEHRVRWDGRDEHGRAAAAGFYFLRLDVNDGTSLVQRVLLLR
ncbi:MAG: FlgD immunoglobulin-like domain containing protein [bacterium]